MEIIKNDWTRDTYVSESIELHHSNPNPVVREVEIEEVYGKSEIQLSDVEYRQALERGTTVFTDEVRDLIWETTEVGYIPELVMTLEDDVLIASGAGDVDPFTEDRHVQKKEIS